MYIFLLKKKNCIMFHKRYEVSLVGIKNTLERLPRQIIIIHPLCIKYLDDII
jgi:hypothetical protein